MELVKHKSLTRVDLTKFSSLQDLWKFVSSHVDVHRKAEYDDWWERTQKVQTQEISEHLFLKECLFSIYVSGFKASTIEKKFYTLLKLHNIEDDGKYIPITSENIVTDFTEIYKVFGNKQKAKAVQELRSKILTLGWEKFHSTYVKSRDPNALKGLPFVGGPALARHITRNFGNINVVKPDVHLNRLAKAYERKDALDLCNALATDSKLSPAQVDIMLWFASIDHKTK